jgi:hypothetical protein
MQGALARPQSGADRSLRCQPVVPAANPRSDPWPLPAVLTPKLKRKI